VERKTVSGIMVTLLLVSMVTVALNVQSAKASGTIYIRADGAVDPPFSKWVMSFIAGSKHKVLFLTRNIR